MKATRKYLRDMRANWYDRCNDWFVRLG